MNGFAKTQPPDAEATAAPAPVPTDDLSLHLLFRLAAAAALIATVFSLTACGGGGGAGASEPPPPPPPPTPSPAPTAPIAAQLSVPTPVGYDADRLAAFNRLNEIRLSAGLGMLAQSTAMDQAAQAHADWMIANNAFTHDETEGTSGFTGTNWARRDEAFGYVPVGGGEAMSAGATPGAGVDALVNAVYHRAFLLAIEPVDVGIGWSDGTVTSFSRPLVIDLTRPSSDAVRGLGQMAQDSIQGVAIWPLNGAHEVPLRLGLESPNPVSGQDVLSLGTPVSITVDRMKTITPSRFLLTSHQTGAVVPTQILTYQSDPNGIVTGSYVAAIPLAALAPAVTYDVAFSGTTLEFPSGAVATIDRAWSFTTAAQ